MTLARRLLVEQRKRTAAMLMTYVEKNVYPKLSPAERSDLRAHLLNALDRYHDLCLDLVKASAEDSVMVNEEVMRLLVSIHQAVRREVSS